jgi:asparagine synthase (glutamine-hydrolysing)
MCGIAGIFALGGQTVSRSLVDRMVASIRHRGPDDAGTYISPCGKVGLGSCRLSIIDLSPAGHMPLCNEDGRIQVVFNGEIYNFSKLRDSLLQHGHKFKSHTDTEVLVHLYEEHGPSYLEYLDGMFAIALWDDRKGLLLLARDRCGEKPLYYTYFANSFRFSSEIKAILEDDSFPREIELEALNQYLTFGFVLPPMTMFRNVGKLAPGEMLVIDRLGKVQRRHYWSALSSGEELEHVRSQTLEAHVRSTRRMLETAVEDCMVSDVPVGAFLSGGVDSSAVVAIMARHTGRPVDCVTVRYPNHPASDESRYAQIVAKRIGATTHLVDITERSAFEAFRDCVYHLDEPIADPAAVNTFIASRTLRSMGVPVALVGEGADELFLGYPYYLRHSRLASLWSFKDRLPRVLVSAVCKVASTALGPLGLSVHRDLLRRASCGEGLFLSSEPFFPDLDKREVAGQRIAGLVRCRPSANVTRACLHDATLLGADVLAQMSLSEFRMRMPEQLLMRVDKLSMAHSIEIRAPFLNRHLAHYALSIPGNVRAAAHTPKYLLKTAVADLLPPETLNRRKMGFGTPVADWFRSSFGVMLEEQLQTSDLFREGLLSRHAIGQILKEHRTGAVSHHTRLWNILCLVEWYDRFKLDGVQNTNQGVSVGPLIA